MKYPLSVNTEANLCFMYICFSSGTGFKLGPVTGEMLADMAEGRGLKYDVTPFRANRFGATEISGATDTAKGGEKSML